MAFSRAMNARSRAVSLKPEGRAERERGDGAAGMRARPLMRNVRDRLDLSNPLQRRPSGMGLPTRSVTLKSRRGRSRAIRVFPAPLALPRRRRSSNVGSSPNRARALSPGSGRPGALPSPRGGARPFAISTNRDRAPCAPPPWRTRVGRASSRPPPGDRAPHACRSMRFVFHTRHSATTWRNGEGPRYGLTRKYLKPERASNFHSKNKRLLRPPNLE